MSACARPLLLLKQRSSASVAGAVAVKMCAVLVRAINWLHAAAMIVALLSEIVSVVAAGESRDGPFQPLWCGSEMGAVSANMLVVVSICMVLFELFKTVTYSYVNGRGCERKQVGLVSAIVAWQ
jgi:hypothetical protein